MTSNPVPTPTASAPPTPAQARALLEELMTRRVLVIDGAMGTMIQARKLGEDDFHSSALPQTTALLAGDNELLLPPVVGAFARPGLVFTDPGDDVWSGTVDYGDGSTAALVIDQDAKTFDLAHTYTASGTFEVAVTVNDEDGGSYTDRLSNVAVWNTVMDTYEYSLGGWFSLLSA